MIRDTFFKRRDDFVMEDVRCKLWYSGTAAAIRYGENLHLSISKVQCTGVLRKMSEISFHYAGTKCL